MQCWPSGINCQNFVLDKGTISHILFIGIFFFPHVIAIGQLVLHAFDQDLFDFISVKDFISAFHDQGAIRDTIKHRFSDA